MQAEFPWKIHSYIRLKGKSSYVLGVGALFWVRTLLLFSILILNYMCMFMSSLGYAHVWICARLSDAKFTGGCQSLDIGCEIWTCIFINNIMCYKPLSYPSLQTKFFGFIQHTAYRLLVHTMYAKMVISITEWVWELLWQNWVNLLLPGQECMVTSATMAHHPSDALQDYSRGFDGLWTKSWCGNNRSLKKRHLEIYGKKKKNRVLDLKYLI